jgi:hypothetical protein
MTCTANASGSPVNVPLSFNYSSVRGTFYGSVLERDTLTTTEDNTASLDAYEASAANKCLISNAPMLIRNVSASVLSEMSVAAQQQYFWAAFAQAPNIGPSIPIPAATIPYPITITPAANAGNTTATNNNNNGNNTCTGNSCLPSAPTITSAGSQTCTLNTAFTINFTATDPQNQAIMYQISWNGDGTVNQDVPASGYVPSGTTESATRTYTMAGPETVEVRAVNSSGLVSPWATFTFNCTAAAATTQPNQCTAGAVCQNNKLCQEDASCNIDPNSCQTCAYGCGSGACLPPPTPTLSLKAVPSLVQQASTTQVTWSATNVSSCNITGTNGDGTGSNATGLWGCTGLQCVNTSNPSVTSSPIENQTIYTIMCTALDNSTSSQQAVVNVVPIFQEK